MFKSATKRPRNASPDEIYTIRLNPSDENERRAIAVIEQHTGDNGTRRQYTLRYVMTQALLMLDGVELPTPEEARIDLEDMATMLGGSVAELRTLIESLRELGFQQVAAPKKTTKAKSNIPANYLANLGKALNRGSED